MADLATGIWRIRKRVLADSEDASRLLVRHVEATSDALAKYGIEIHDPAGECFVPGMALSVLAFQPTPEAFEETIQETIKPSIYFRDQLIQYGEVIVAVPIRAEPADLTGAPATAAVTNGAPSDDVVPSALSDAAAEAPADPTSVADSMPSQPTDVDAIREHQAVQETPSEPPSPAELDASPTAAETICESPPPPSSQPT